MKWQKWVFGIIAGVAAFALWYSVLRVLGFKDDPSINYFKNLYNYTWVVALLTCREVYRYFKKRESKSI